nr:phage Gp37/Gp68 family protein [Clostridia bacterium]
CEDRSAAEKRLPVYLELPLRHHAVMIEPMLSAVDLRPFFASYRGEDGRPKIRSVSVGGESGPDARPCDFDWVLDIRTQCVENGVKFSYHQTGANLIKDGKTYRIPRSSQHKQARRAGLDHPGEPDDR